MWLHYLFVLFIAFSNSEHDMSQLKSIKPQVSYDT